MAWFWLGRAANSALSLRLLRRCAAAAVVVIFVAGASAQIALCRPGSRSSWLVGELSGPFWLANIGCLT